MPIRAARFGLFFALLAQAGAALAWHDAGHMTVAQIAWSRMTPAARAAATRILEVGATAKAYDFVTSASWADDVKTPATAPWHHIFLYFRKDGKPTDLKPAAQNAASGIEKFEVILADRSASPADRAIALRYLIHLVGDIHQPMHCCSRITKKRPLGDDGGKKVKLAIPAGWTTDPPKNLSALWQTGCGALPHLDRPLTAAAKAQVEAAAARAEAAVSPGELKAARRVTDPETWAREGMEIAKNFAYSTPKNQTPSPEYLRRGRKIALSRLAIAGARLADLLDRLLG